MTTTSERKSRFEQHLSEIYAKYAKYLRNIVKN